MEHLAWPLLVATLITAGLSAVAVADDAPPFEDIRAKSPDGQHVVIVQKTGIQQGSYEIHVLADAEEPLLGAGEISGLPREVWTLDREPAAVLFERHGQFWGRGPALRLLAKDGLRWSLSLTEVFPDEHASFPIERRSGRLWYTGSWVDEDRGHVVLIGAGDHLATVDLATGDVAPASPEVLATRFTSGSPSARRLALEVAARRQPARLAERTLPIARDTSEDLGIRIRAAVCAMQDGAPEPFGALWKRCLGADQPLDVQLVALRHLPEDLGLDALPLIRSHHEHFRTHERRWEVNDACGEALVALAAHHPTALIDVIDNERESEELRRRAMHAAARSGSPKLIPALAAQVRSRRRTLAQEAIDALGEMATNASLTSLTSLLHEGTDHDFRIIWRLCGAKHVAALHAMIDAWERMDTGVPGYGWTHQSLVRLTGVDHGQDPATWRDALERR